MNNVLSKIREELAVAGKSEFTAQNKQPELKKLMEQMQDLRLEMAQAKKKAAEEAAQPYIETLSMLEKRYAFMLKLST